MATTDTITTADQLLQATNLGRCELVRGELIRMAPAGYRHGWIVVKLSTALCNFVDQNSLGVVSGAETGFVLQRNPDTVRAPDVAFVTRERHERGNTAKFFEGPPDLAIEVLSPDDRHSEVLSKVQQWLDAGCRAVWVIDPETQTVTQYRDNHATVLSQQDTVTDEQLLPGFRLAVADVFRS